MSWNDVVVIDSGGANLASVRFALERLGVAAEISTRAETIRSAGRVILPGVGAAGDVMGRLQALGLDEVIPALTQPVLGICVGLQVLYERCEEDDVNTLGLLPGTVRRLPSAPGLSIPQMGWNRLHSRGEHPLLATLDADAHFYFVHSYAAPPGEGTLATAYHGSEFTALAGRGNFLATQFHPERSARWGHELLNNFLHLPAEALSCA
ncbi:MAG: imidazole glycerol phosphate synthase subunit HisH [Pseudomonadota bacterium]